MKESYEDREKRLRGRKGGGRCECCGEVSKRLVTLASLETRSQKVKQQEYLSEAILSVKYR